MLNRKKFIFVILISVIVSMVIGIFIGQAVSKSFSKSPEKNTDYYTDFDKKEGTDNIEEITNNGYPFSLYESFLVNSSKKIVNELNNNPIDRIYQKKYAECKSPEEEQMVLSDWNAAYENEFKNAMTVFENSINKKAASSESSAEDILKASKDYSDNCSRFTNSASQFAYSFEEFNLGQGTNHAYNLLYNDLELNRINALRLIECIYMLDEDYIWSEQAN